MNDNYRELERAWRQKQQRDRYDWSRAARPEQRLPDVSFRVWLILAGRGWGKTRVGAETVRIWARTNPIVNVIAATADDLRDICIEGPAGILNICPDHERPIYYPAKRLVEWANGSRMLLFSADEPERLRGKQSQKIWMDEISSWQYPKEAFDQAMFGLRLGSNPQAIITCTPRPIKMLKDLISAPGTLVTRGASYENRANLAPACS